MRIRPAYPYFGSKAAVASIIWEALGEVPNYVEPFAGSCAVLLARPRPGKVETVNDLHAFIPCFLRAVRDDPEAVAHHANWPVSEIDMHARHRWLVDAMTPEMVERLRADPGFYDAKIAGWWVWGASCWIGSGWCEGDRTREKPRIPALSGNGGPKSGDGINRTSLTQKMPRLQGRDGDPQRGVGLNRQDIRRLPHLAGPNNRGKVDNPTTSDGSGVGYGRGIFASGRREDLLAYFQQLAERLALVRITCGDWKRVCTPAVTTSHGLTGVLLDPPYPSQDRATVYAHDDRDVAHDVAEWAREHGDDPHLRIVLCGYSGEHEMPGWREVAWKSRGGYGRGKNANATRERLWLSPHCRAGVESQAQLFATI